MAKRRGHIHKRLTRLPPPNHQTPKMLKKTALLTLCLITAITAVATDISAIVLSGKRIATADGLPNNTIYDIVQDRDGFVWLGAAYGLCRYDGYSFTNITSLSSDKSKDVDANIGNLYYDSGNNLLWIHTATLTFACYDLTTGRFVDYTGRGDENRPFRRLTINGSELWMYDHRSGVRHVRLKDGKFVCTDYNADNGRLSANRVPRVVVDGNGAAWVLTSDGLLRIDSTGHTATIVAGRRYITATTFGDGIACLSEGNRIEVFNTDGTVAKSLIIPQEMGTTDNVKSNFVWQGKWMLFCKSTFMVDLQAGTVTKPDALQVPDGLLLDAADGYFFESNGSGRLWIFPPTGEAKALNLLPDTDFTSERRRKYTVRRGKDGLFYIATYGNGLFIYDADSDALRHFSAKDGQPVIDSDYLTTLSIGNDGTVWAAQEMMGVACISVSRQSVAAFATPAGGHSGDLANCIKMTIATDGGNALFSTMNNRLYSLDAKTLETKPVAKTDACAYAYLRDSKGHTWIGTRGEGLYIDGINYSLKSTPHRAPSNNIYDIKEDSHGRIWMATYEDGLLMARLEEGMPPAFTLYLNRNLNESRLHQIEIDSAGRIWVASNNGLYVADTRKDPLTDDDFRCFNTKNGKFPFDEVRCLKFSSTGHLWVGSNGNGVLRCSFTDASDEVDYKAISDKEGLANNTVSSITEDYYGHVWVATESGLSRIYDHDLKVKTYLFGKMPGRNIYSERCVTTMADGRLLFGTRNGLTIITPQREYGNEEAAPKPARITDIAINGVSASDSCLFPLAPTHMESVTLKHNATGLAIYFSNFDFSNTESTLYQYYLEGIDNDWQRMTSVNHVEYGKIAPGKYTFHLRALSDNEWSSETTLGIVVLPPWYNTLWAWLAYIAAATAIGLYLYHNAREKLRLHQQMEVERQMDEFKLSFFTNVTHEFRTPIAIIQGAVDKMQETGDRPPSKATLQTAGRGIKRLRRLVNQLMEFRKVNTGNMHLALEEGDIICFTRNIFDDFRHLARQKDITTTFIPFDRNYMMPFDRRMVESIIYNLMSNAIKYTPERGRVSLAIKKVDGQIEITVEDSGAGISDERQQLMFKPFMQGYASHGGMGVGLYNAMQMTLLHKGSLTYRRKSTEGGSTFIVSLPADGSPYTESDYKAEPDRATATPESHGIPDGETIMELHQQAFNDIKIAIIEDDPDMRRQLTDEMGTLFLTDSYASGEAAIEGMATKKPALVICDVMLPDISGYDIVRHIKANADTADTPVIMLTALDDDDCKLKSYNAGADDYMVKPCSPKLLKARAVQLIGNAFKRQGLSGQATERQTEATDSTKAARIVTSAADKRFIEQMNAIISQHVGDPNFTVDKLAEMMKLGRTKLFYKTKELTGTSPNKYLQNKRMDMAATLLLKGGLTVAEVSYKVGIHDASYFNRCFKAKFGVVPSKYGKKP